MKDIIGKYGEVLSRNFLFDGLDADWLSSAVEILGGDISSYKKGELVHAAGSPLKNFGIVLSGALQVCSDDIEGNRMIMAEVGEGASFGEAICFLRLEEEPVSITASRDATVLWLNPDGIFSHRDGMCPELEKRFAGMIAKRTLDMNARIQILSKIKLRDKLIAYFTDLSRRQNGRLVTVSMSREDMAVYLGTDRSALSRELSAMKKDGLIDYRRNEFKLIFGK